MNKLLIILCLLSPLTSYATCEIETYERIIKINKIQDERIIKSSNCSEDIRTEFTKFVSNTSGKMNAKHLKRYFKNENGLDLNIKPKSFTIKDIDILIQESIQDNSIVVKNINSLFSTSSLNLAAADTLNITCQSCDRPGEKNILLTLNKKKIWLSALIHRKRKAYTLAKSITDLNMKLDRSFFKETIISDKGHTLLFEDLDQISFYKPTKLLRAGEVLKKYDLRRRVLVKFGQKVQVNIANQSIKLKTKAVARRNGYIGDLIELVNEKSNKVIQAKVVNYNKVEVQL